jgi:hypothetical protein
MMNYAMEKLKTDLDKLIEECANKGVEDGGKCLEIVKTALSAKAKILTIEAMERVQESGFGRGYDRRANGQFRDDCYHSGGYRDEGDNYRDGNGSYRDSGMDYRDNGGNYRDSGMEHLKRMLENANPQERQFIEKLLHKM